MTRRPTYGERMRDWEDGKDERAWYNNFKKALEEANYEYLEQLVEEGIRYEYSFPSIVDPVVLEIISKFEKSQ